MPRFTSTEHQSLNESISGVANPAAALARAQEYAELLEDVITALCEELEVDPVELMEDVMTGGRMREHDRALKPLYAANRKTKPGETNRAAERGITARRNLADREQRSQKKLYGRGGKVLKRKPTAKERRESDHYDYR